MFGLLEMLTQRPRWARVLSGAAISGLLAQLRDWFLERDAEEWDRQIDRDAACGKLDKVFDKSVADLETDLPLDIG